MFLFSFFIVLFFSQNILAGEPSRQLTDASAQTEEDPLHNPRCGSCLKSLDISMPIICAHCTHVYCERCFGPFRNGLGNIGATDAAALKCIAPGCDKPLAQANRRLFSPTPNGKLEIDMRNMAEQLKCVAISISLSPIAGKKYFLQPIVCPEEKVYEVDIPPCYSVFVNFFARAAQDKRGDDQPTMPHMVNFIQEFYPPFKKVQLNYVITAAGAQQNSRIWLQTTPDHSE